MGSHGRGTKNNRQKPGSTGFQPVHAFKVTRRNLPHWQEPGRVYFITWRCRPTQRLSVEERTITLSTIRYWDTLKWTVYTAVVLPDHVHILAQPLPKQAGGVFNLTEILHSVKSFSSQKINQQRGEQGSIWQAESFDRIVRDEAEFMEKWQYIRNNPLKTELALYPEDYPWLYEKGE